MMVQPLVAWPTSEQAALGHASQDWPWRFEAAAWRPPINPDPPVFRVVFGPEHVTDSTGTP